MEQGAVPAPVSIQRYDFPLLGKGCLVIITVHRDRAGILSGAPHLAKTLDTPVLVYFASALSPSILSPQLAREAVAGLIHEARMSLHPPTGLWGGGWPGQQK